VGLLHALAWAAITIGVLRRGIRMSWWFALALLGEAIVILITVQIWSATPRIGVNRGVVLIEDSTARTGPNADVFPQAYADGIVGSGVESDLLRTRSGWAELHMPDGTNAWVPIESIALVSPFATVPAANDRDAVADDDSRKSAAIAEDE
jgi:hypothetical protein